MRKSILLLVATIIGSCCITGSANITTLGTINYKGFMQSSINSPTEVNLTLIYSTMTGASLTVDKIGFIPSLNQTKFVFTSNAVTPKWWWTNLSVEPYIFQDKNTLELYKIYIDYSSVKVPPIPSEVELQDLQIIFNETFNRLKQAKANLTNLSAQYNLTMNELIQLRNHYNNTSDNYSDISNDYNTTLLEMIKLNINLTDATNKYLEMYDAFNRSSANASLYTDFYNSMLSTLNAFWFENDYGNNKYRTISSYEKEIEEQKNVLGTFPFYLIFTILIVLTFTLLLARRIWGKKKRTHLETEALEGYTEESRKADKFIARLFKMILKPFARRNSTAKNTVASNPIQQSIPTSSQSHESLINDIDKVFQKNIEPVHNRLEFIEEKVKKHDDIISNIDNLIKKPQPKKVGT